MISYVEKGIGLHDAIRDAGYWLYQENGVWWSSDDAAVQAIIDGFNPLPLAKTAGSNAVDDAAGAARSRYLTIQPGQDATYQYKAADAAAYLANGVVGSWLQSEAAATGVTVAQAAANINVVAQAWIAKGSQIEGRRMQAKTAINAATDWTTIAGIAAQAVADLGAM